MWTGNWWWRRQIFLGDDRGTIAPVIIASDKTQMTKLSGNQSAYPVYLTIGNISKAYRRRATKRATVIIGYLPVDSFKDIPEKALRERLKGELLHYSMSSIMKPLEEAGQTGVEMWCADGRLRWIYPLLAAFVGDWPEQNDMACTKRSGCPKCLKRGAGRGDERSAAPRTRVSTLSTLDRYLETGRKTALNILGLKPWWPWWANLPGVEFATCIAPDLLHQIHKGLFKGHAMRWIQRKLGKPTVDERFASMTRAQDLRHFKRGISVVSQWTGREAKEMEKVFLPLIAEHRDLPKDLVAFIRALLDFSYIARAARLTDGKLKELRQALSEMHRLKHVLVSSGVYQRLGRLDNIPKWHMVSHYADSIRELGMPDGYNTEGPEYLHIVYVKRGFAASNKRDAILQIIEYCERLEALRIHRAHLDEYYGERGGEPKSTAVFVADEDGVYDPKGSGGDKRPQKDGGKGADGDDGDDSRDSDNGNGDDNGSDEEGEEGQRRQSAASDADAVEHPWPEFAIVVQPTRQVTLAQLVEDYGATSLERALRSFLQPYAHGHWFILPSDQFGVWHKLTLYHHPLSFAPDEPRQRDVIRVRPPLRDTRGRSLRSLEPIFDTALFLYDSRQIGLHRYRAGRVRAIFQLPNRLQYLYPGELVYLELFSTFDHNLSPKHRLHATSHAGSAHARQYTVIPVEHVMLGCHLAPNFRHVRPKTYLDSRVDLLSATQRFFFNHYYNLYTFQLIQYWRHLEQLD
ncbi:hypothetical protein FS749_016627 [Ceratobasidium sp. UAMH 11750]|nr:hypothetical protein FS749_016627 [Ceratobasidium sp. UAMH 11750]